MSVFVRDCTRLLAVAAIGLLSCTSAQANLAITPSGTNNSTTTLTGGTTADRAAAHSLSIGPASGPIAPTLGAQVVATTRYTSNAAADRGSSTSGGSAVAQVNTSYVVSFAIPNPGAGRVYDVKLDTVIRGGLTAREDSTLNQGGSGLSRLTSITSSIANLSVVYGGGQLQQGGTSNTTGVEISVNDARTHTITGLSGANTVTVSFSWATRAESPQNLVGGDEHAARFGINDVLGGMNPDNYPGAPARNINLDGHFVTATVTITAIPEPSSAVLAVSGLVGLCGIRRRRR
ncbi:MAG: hypothetical protein KF752_09120 [Pirellulaceae bacterium]|nr:hypothetical protein [Pirellulaceae bacterium]